MQRHRKAVHKRRVVHHDVAKRRAPMKQNAEEPSHAAENRGYDLYDLVNYGYDLSKGIIDDPPPDISPEPDDVVASLDDEIDAYSPS